MPKSPKSADFDESRFWRREINGEIVEVPERLRPEVRRSEQELKRYLADAKAGEKPALGPEQGADFELVANSDRSSQYTAADYTQALDDHGVLASVGSVGRLRQRDGQKVRRLLEDRADRRALLARARTQLELAVVQYIAWFNNDRLHESRVTPLPRRSNLYTLPRGSEPQQSNLNWKPTTTVSVKPDPAHFAQNGGVG